MVIMKGNPYEVSCCICRKINGTLFHSKTLKNYVHMKCLKKRIDDYSSVAATYQDNEYEENKKYVRAYKELLNSYGGLLKEKGLV